MTRPQGKTPLRWGCNKPLCWAHSETLMGTWSLRKGMVSGPEKSPECLRVEDGGDAGSWRGHGGQAAPETARPPPPPAGLGFHRFLISLSPPLSLEEAGRGRSRPAGWEATLQAPAPRPGSALQQRRGAGSKGAPCPADTAVILHHTACGFFPSLTPRPHFTTHVYAPILGENRFPITEHILPLKIYLVLQLH